MPLTLRCLRRIARHSANHLDKARLWRFAFRHLTAGPSELGWVDFDKYRSRTFSFKRPCIATRPLPDFHNPTDLQRTSLLHWWCSACVRILNQREQESSIYRISLINVPPPLNSFPIFLQTHYIKKGNLFKFLYF